MSAMIDSEVAALLIHLNAGFPDVASMTGPQARAMIRARLQPTVGPIPVRSVDEHRIPSPSGDIPVRIYRPFRLDAPDRQRGHPLVVFAHGGGFVFCDLDSHDDLCRSMAAGSGAVVVSVGYRLAPEYRWPAAADDVTAVVDWALAHTVELGADPTRLMVAGDSAGGNLAAVAALRCRDRGRPDLSGQILMYPVLAADFETPSYREFADGYYNTARAMRWYWDQYVPDPDDRRHPYAAPLLADVGDLPPTIVVTAGHDPLCTEGVALVARLRRAGVPVTHHHHDGAIHGFLTMPTLDLCRRARIRLWHDVGSLPAAAQQIPD